MKEARFAVRNYGKRDVEAIKQVVKDSGFTVSAIKAQGPIFEATIVKVAEGSITLIKKGDDQNRTYSIDKGGKISLEDEPATLEELKEGFIVRVTTDDMSVITKIEAKSKKK